MSLSMEKGQRINVSKESGGAHVFVMGLGWDDGPYDLDASVVLCQSQPDGSSKVIGSPGFIYFGQRSSAGNKNDDPQQPIWPAGVFHMGDNLTGAGAGDDEQIIIDTSKLPAGVDRMDFFLTVFKASERKHNFGMVNNAYARIGSAKSDGQGGFLSVQGQTNLDMDVIKQYDLSEDFSTSTGVQMGSLYSKDGEWRFQAMGADLGKAEIADIFEQYQPGVTKR